jgi:hypothetical protein
LCDDDNSELYESARIFTFRTNTTADFDESHEERSQLAGTMCGSV